VILERLDAAIVTREHDERVAALARFVERCDERKRGPRRISGIGGISGIS
jgi:hypothetical protein